MNRALPFLLMASAVSAARVSAQPSPPPSPPPATDIHLADLTGRGAELKVGAPLNITNREGYNNQPSFSPDGKGIFYTALLEDGQTDIFRYDLASRTTARVRHTPESEYSPTVTPDGKALSVIRVEADKTQRLWRLPLADGEPELILRDLKPVGYHAWADDSTLVLFVLGSPPTLQLARPPDGRPEVVLDNPGRSLHRVPGRHAVSFVHKVAEKEWWIKELDLATRKVTALVRTLEGSEDFAWTPQGALLMAQGPALFTYEPGRAASWREVARFPEPALQKITRLAVSPKGDRLALVSDRRTKPKD